MSPKAATHTACLNVLILSLAVHLSIYIIVLAVLVTVHFCKYCVTSGITQ